MDKMTKLRRLCLQWVFVLEGYGNIDKWPETDRKEIEEDLRKENKHPDQWIDDECIDFMNQIIENIEVFKTVTIIMDDELEISVRVSDFEYEKEKAFETLGDAYTFAQNYINKNKV